MGQLVATIDNLLNLGALVGVALCGLYLGFAGLKFITSNGVPSAIESSKSAAFNACVGLGVVLSARVIASIIQGAIVR